MTAPRRETVPAAHGHRVHLKAGDIIEVINTHGTQVVDTWAFATDDPTDHMSMAHSRSVNSRLWPAIGQSFVSSRRRKMLCIVADTTPGHHDSLLCACNAAIYAELGCTGYHRSCEDNLHEMLRAEGQDTAFTPSPANLFMRVAAAPDGAILRHSPSSAAGDKVVLRAEMDLLLVMSACPQDITPINSESRTPRDVALLIHPAE